MYSNKLNTLIQFLILTIFAFGLSACGGSSSPDPEPPPPPVASNDATLSALTLSAGTISPAFAAGTNSYTLETTNDTTTVTPTVNQASATVTVNGASVASGSASGSIALPVGDTVINIVVTAEDGSTTQTYAVTVSRLSTDATLSALTLSAGTISPAFSAGTNSYTLETTNNATTITPTINQANATVTVEGVTATSGIASGAIELSTGDTVITIVVTAQDGSTTQTYTVTVSRLSTDATLSALTLSAGTISPAFAAGTNSYTLDTTNETTTVTPTVNQANATVTVNGASVASGSASGSIALSVGDTAINVVVTAQDGSTTQTYAVTVTATAASTVVLLELVDPEAYLDGRFGTSVVQLANGNIVVSDSLDDTAAIEAGAVHLYSPNSSTPIASIYGDAIGDKLGSSSITALGNSNYVIASELDDGGGIANAGTVMLMDGSTGLQIGTTISGDVANDKLGESEIIALGNNNYVIVSQEDDEGGLLNAGSVRLVNGTTGVQIGVALVGDFEGDQLGSNGITVLDNNNYVIASIVDDEDGIINAGSVRLVNGSTGVQIGAALVGDNASDLFGNGGITALGNNNYVIASSVDDVGGIENAGSVRLVDGSTGVQIGATLAGDVLDDQLGKNGITALGNNNYVVVSTLDDVAGIINAGSVSLMNGSTGEQIGGTMAGTVSSEIFGQDGITVLSNNNYVIASAFSDVNNVVNSGRVVLMNGSTGVQIGDAMAGDNADDQFGRRGTTALGNNNYVIRSDVDDIGSLADAGSVRLMNGSTGAQIGDAITGDVSTDNLGRSSITVLGNNNYVIASSRDEEGGVANVGSVRLVNGSTGVQIGTTLAGDVESDELGNAGVFALNNNNYVIASSRDEEGGVVDAGSVRAVNGDTGAQIGDAIVGTVSDDLNNIDVISSANGDYYILSLPFADNGALSDSGKVQIVVPEEFQQP